MFPIKDIMSTHLVTVTKETPILEAAQLLIDKCITGIPVVDRENNLVGILSELDVLRLLQEKSDIAGLTVEKFMTRKVSSFEDSVSAIEVCEFFLNNPGKRRVPITHQGKLVGLVSSGDIVKLIVKLGIRQRP